MTQIIIFFNKPYDMFESKRHRLIISFSISVFVWFFLFTFGVFDFDYFPPLNRLYYTGIYSLFCLISLLFNLFLLQDYLLKKPTFASSFLWSLWIMCCVAFSNFILTTVIFKWEEFSMLNLMKNQIYTLSIGMIITPAIILIHYNYVLRKRVGEIKTKRARANQTANGH